MKKYIVLKLITLYGILKEGDPEDEKFTKEFNDLLFRYMQRLSDDFHFFGVLDFETRIEPGLKRCSYWEKFLCDHGFIQEKKDLKPGTQIIYVPIHADGPKHPDAEEGFVTSMSGEYHAFCRYWSKHNLIGSLRTTSCSECTPLDCIIVKDTHVQRDVDRLLRQIKEEQG